MVWHGVAPGISFKVYSQFRGPTKLGFREYKCGFLGCFLCKRVELPVIES